MNENIEIEEKEEKHHNWGHGFAKFITNRLYKGNARGQIIGGRGEGSRNFGKDYKTRKFIRQYFIMQNPEKEKQCLEKELKFLESEIELIRSRLHEIKGLKH